MKLNNALEQKQNPNVRPHKCKYNIFYLVFIGQVILMSSVILLSILNQKMLWFDEKIIFGFDYRDFYIAAQRYLSNTDPYYDVRFTKPPLVILLNLLALKLPHNVALNFYFVLNLAATFVMLMLAELAFLRGKDNYNKQPLGILFGTLMFSYPVFFVLDRGNLDGFVAAFCFLGFYLWSSNKRELIAGLAFGIAFCLKLYPILLLVPFIIFRKWRIILGFFITILINIAVSPMTWWNYITRSIYYRVNTNFTVMKENGSLADTLHFFLSFTPRPLLEFNPLLVQLSYILVAIGILLCFIMDLKLKKFVNSIQQSALATLYIPFMTAVPKVTYHYEFLFMLPLAFVWSYLSEEFFDNKEWAIYILGIVLVLTQFPVFGIINIFGISYWMVSFLPGFGTLCLMIASIVFRGYLIKKLDQPNVVTSR